MILLGNRLNRAVIEGCNVEGVQVPTAPKGSINYILIRKWIELSNNSVLDSVAHLIVLIYYGCCNHYNARIVEKMVELKVILDGVQPKTSLFSTSHFILVNYKVEIIYLQLCS